MNMFQIIFNIFQNFMVAANLKELFTFATKLTGLNKYQDIVTS